MRRKGGVVTFLVVGSVAVAALATLIADGGWVLWLPVVVGLAIGAKLWCTIAR